MSENNSLLSKTFERLSSGQRINSAADDAAGLSLSSQLNADTRVLSQAVRNVNDSISMMSIARSALGSLSDITIRQKELAGQAANGAYSSEQRSAMNKEAAELTNEYNRILSSTAFNGGRIFDTTWESTVIQAGSGEEATLSLKFGDELAAKIQPGSYFNVESAGRLDVIYFRLDGQGAAPTVSGARSVTAVDLYSNATSQVTDITIADPPPSGSWFYLYTKDSSHYVWFNDGSAVDPELGEGGIEVNIAGLSTPEELADALKTALDGSGDFNSVDLGGGTVRVTNVESGRVDEATDDWSGVWIETREYGHDRVITADEIAQKAAEALAVWPMNYYSTTVLDGGVLEWTATVSGRYSGTEDVNSGTWIDVRQEGSGLTQYSETWAKGFSFGDLNGDGIQDLVTANWGGYGLSVRLGQGDGTLGLSTTYASSPAPRDVALGDMNGDGALDVALSGSGGVSIFLNKGDGTFENRVQYSVSSWADRVALADLDGDGDMDLVAASTADNGTIVRFNDGSGGFNASITLSGINRAVAAGDFNHDGQADIATASWNASGPGVITIWTHNGDQTFSAAFTAASGPSIMDLQAGDLNGDGWTDLLDKDNSTTAGVLLNQQNGSFAARTTYDMGPGTYSAALADLNGDGSLDVVANQVGVGKLTLRFNDGSGTFGTAQTYTYNPIVVNYGMVGAGDADSDGDTDIAASDDHGVHILYNQGAGNFSDPRGDSKQINRFTFGDARGRVLVDQIDLGSQAAARQALTTLSTRLERIGREVGVLGASESRLENALQLLEVSRENKMAASARITDADIAQETAGLVKRQILQQAAAAVLAQADQAPALALTLLR